MDEEAVAKIMAEDALPGTADARRRRKRSEAEAKKAEEKRRADEWVSRHPPASMGNAEMSALYHTHAASAALGSSQLDGCKGDFCHLELELQNMESQRLHSMKGMSEFRRKLLDLAGAEGEGEAKPMGAEGDGRMMTVPLRVVVQARKEARLVDNMIKRHRRGQVRGPTGCHTIARHIQYADR